MADSVELEEFNKSPDLSETDDDDLESPPSTPVKVNVIMWVNQVTEVDSVSQTFKLDVDIEYQWYDPRVVKLNPEPELEYDEYVFADDINPEEIWQPRVEIINIADGDPAGNEPTYIVKKLKSWDKPLVTMERTYQVTLYSQMHLQAFPFDEQVLRFYCRSEDQSREELQFHIPTEAQKDCSDNIDHAVHFEEWHLLEAKSKTCTHLYEYVARSEGLEEAMYSEFQLNLKLKRKQGFYMLKIITTIMIVLAMEVAAFFTEPDDLGTRISVSLTLLLTAVAFQFVVSESLPKIAYNTCLDYLFLIMYFMIGLSYLQNVVIFQLHRSGTTLDTLDQIDVASAGAYAVVWLVVAFAFYVALPWAYRSKAPLQQLPTAQRLAKYGLKIEDIDDDIDLDSIDE